MPQRRQRQILGGVRSGQLLDEAPGQPRRNLTQLDSLFLAPGEEAANDAGVGAAGVGVGDAGGEELIGGEQGVLPGALQDGGGAIEGLGGGQEGGLGKGLNHGDIGDDNILYRTFPSYDSRAIFSVKGSLLALPSDQVVHIDAERLGFQSPVQAQQRLALESAA